jgi:hypothetical protein
MFRRILPEKSPLNLIGAGLLWWCRPVEINKLKLVPEAGLGRVWAFSAVFNTHP